MQFDKPNVVRAERVVEAAVDALRRRAIAGLLELALQAWLLQRQVVAAQHHVECRGDHRLAGARREQVVGGEHYLARLRHRLSGERHVDGHLVAVEVGVERAADERVQLDRAPLYQHRLERLDAQTVEGRCAVEQHRPGGDHIFQYVPDLRPRAFDDALGALDVVRAAVGDERVHDERLEQLQRHALRQAALVQLQVRADDDDRAARVVDALAEQVLAEAALLSLQHVRQRLQLMVAGARDGPAAAAVIDQRIDRFLEHALLVAHDNLRRAQVYQPLQPVVTVDHAAVEVVQVTRGEAAAVELDHGPQIGWQHRQDAEDRPFCLVAAPAQRLDYAQTFRRLLAPLAARRSDLLLHPHPHLLHVEALEDLEDSLCAHAGFEDLAELFLVVFVLGFREQRRAVVDYWVNERFQLVQFLLVLLQHLFPLCGELGL